MHKVQAPMTQVADYGAVTNQQTVTDQQPLSSTVSVKNSNGESVAYHNGEPSNCAGTCVGGSIGAIIGGFLGFGVGSSCGCATGTKIGWTLGSSAIGLCTVGFCGYNFNGS